MDLTKKATNPQRLPPPALFQAPPSRNASNLSLSLPPASSALATPQPSPLHRTRSPRIGEGENSGKSGHLSPFGSRRQSPREADGTDAIWQEMQTALSEVELSAVTSQNVFGEKHTEALEDLRLKQLKLAQAWARSEADDEVVDPNSGADAASANATLTQPPGESNPQNETTEQSAGHALVSHHTPNEETEKDIRLARKRREANDRYFDRVNQGALDVVAKLEDVAQAMRTVERESKDIWSDSESATSPTR